LDKLLHLVTDIALLSVYTLTVERQIAQLRRVLNCILIAIAIAVDSISIKCIVICRSHLITNLATTIHHRFSLLGLLLYLLLHITDTIWVLQYLRSDCLLLLL
jgi:hypothetical protein